jgi:cysteine desulfurase/selenocysteine lyase
LLDSFEPGETPAKFEAGTPPIVSAIGLGTAIDYLSQIGLDAIHRHELLLTRRAHEVLATVEGVRILGPSPEQKAGIVSFTVEGVHAHDVAEVLDRSGIAVRAGHHCAMPLHKRFGISATARASFYLYNTLAEVEQLAPALEQAKSIFRRKSRRGIGD